MLDIDIQDLFRRTNPWWIDKPGPVLPSYRRWAYAPLFKSLHSELAPITILRGPRQVGKTTLQLQIIDELLESGVHPRRILRVQYDEVPSLKKLKEPLLRLVDWYERTILGETLNEAAHRDNRAYLFLDEVQNLPDWAVQLKHLVDHSTVRVLLTGSSSLRIAAGKDSLAGRISTFTLGTLLLREIAAVRGLAEREGHLPTLFERDILLDKRCWTDLAHLEVDEALAEAFTAFSQRGGYPIVHRAADAPWNVVAAQLNENVIKRAIQHDLRLSESGGRRRDPDLLEELFRLACRYIGQTPGRALFVRSLKESLDADVGWQRVLSYLKFLDGALLLRLIRPLELRMKKVRSVFKLCLCDHGLRSSWLGERIPLDPVELERVPELSSQAGHIAESVVGAFLRDIPALQLNHLPERGTQPEVDYIITIGDRRIPLEVKYQRRIDPFRDTLGIRAFIETTANRAPFGLLITQRPVQIDDPRIIGIPLVNLLLLR